MFWLILLTILLLFLCWILFSPFELEIDTRIPHASFKWRSIAKADVIYEDQRWLFSLDTYFYHHKWPLSRVFRKRRKEKPKKIRRTGKGKFKIPLSRILEMLSTFHIKEWRLALDANESLQYVMAYPLNFFPNLHQHVQINFEDISYFRIRISNRAWRMVYVWIK